MPFLENVTRGRGIPAERLAEVGRHFAVRRQEPDQRSVSQAARGIDERITQPWHAAAALLGKPELDPYLHDELRAIERDGHRRVLAVVTSAYPSYSSCRQYRENLFDAAQGTQIQIDRIRHYANHPGFVQASVDASLKALDTLGERADEARLVFVTHSIPTAMAETAGPAPRSRRGAYVDWHAAVASEVAQRVAQRRGRSYDHDLVYCSRSGPPASHGWSQTSTIICVSSPGVAFRQWWWCRSVSCPITWRWSSIWIPRRQPPPRNAAWPSRGPVPPAIIRRS